MTLELSGQQQKAIEMVRNWRGRWHNGDRSQQVFRLFGAAGTGKTTIARLLSSAADSIVRNAAPTGKAASVLTKKGCPATTIHKLIYQPMEAGKAKLDELKKEESAILKEMEDSTGPTHQLQEELREVRNKIRAENDAISRPFFALKLESDLREADLLNLDESSMVDQMTGEDLLSFNVPILALGDPFQLPPVKGAGFFTQVQPDILLTEVHRQALGSPILELATIVRQGHALPPNFDKTTDSGTARIHRGKPDPTEVIAADQILCGRNSTRVSLNRRCRELLGYSEALPMTGDRLVCLKNNHDLGLMNGTIWNVVHNYGMCASRQMTLDLVSEDGVQLHGVLVHTPPFLGKEVERWELRDAEHFDFGYALTVHKSQGSEWPSVVLFDDWTANDRQKWLYTGITRASEKLIIVQ